MRQKDEMAYIACLAEKVILKIVIFQTIFDLTCRPLINDRLSKHFIFFPKLSYSQFVFLFKIYVILLNQ